MSGILDSRKAELFGFRTGDPKGFHACELPSSQGAIGTGEASHTEAWRHGVAEKRPVCCGFGARPCTPASVAPRLSVSVCEAPAHPGTTIYCAGSRSPFSAKPRKRKRHESHAPQARPSGDGS